MSMPRYAVVPLALLAAGSCHVEFFQGAVDRETRSSSVAHVRGRPLRIRSSNGSIKVRRSKGDWVEIQATLRARGVERLQATRIASYRTEDGTLVIEVEWPDDGRMGNEGCSFDVRIPGASSFHLHSSNGSIRMAGFEGDVKLRSSNGSIEVEDHEGAVNVKTSNGRVRIDGKLLAVNAHTSNASIRVGEAAGPIAAMTSNGSVELGLSKDNPGPLAVRTSNASVDLSLGQAFEGELKLRTSNARVRLEASERVRVLDRGKHSAHLDFGRSQGVSKVRTSNGSIRVSQR